MPARVITEELIPRGPFSLEAAATFGFGPTEGRLEPFDGAMRLAFPVDGGVGYAGAVLRQPAADGPVTVELQIGGAADPGAAVAQVARIVSLDHDGAAFAEVGGRDPVIGGLQAAHHGQRPVLFHSPYEAAAWSIISARRPSAIGARWRASIAEQFGASFELAGRSLAAFPQPDALARADLSTILDATKTRRLAQLTGYADLLDVAALQALGPEQAFDAVQDIEGIGPFYATLITVRGTGFADAMIPVAEPKALAAAGLLYDEPGMTLARLTAIAERWRPFRTWATVLIRVDAGRASAAGAG